MIGQSCESVVIFGPTGYLGCALASSMPDAARIDRARLDWASGAPPLDRLGIESGEFRVAILAAGITDIGACERDPETSWRVNVEATVHLAQQLLERGIRVVAFSSDYVFDGAGAPYDENAPTAPLNAYGRQKAEIERRLAGLDGLLVLRLSKVYGIAPGDGSLLDEMASSLAAGKPVRAASDQIFNPIRGDEAIDAIMALVDLSATGLVNLCGSEPVSRLALARAVAAHLRVSHDLVEEISLDDLDEPFRRPKDTRMINQRLTELTGLDPSGPAAALESLETS